jgi:choline-sulfatase
LCPEDIGFDYVCRGMRDDLADECVRFVAKKRRTPFFLVASFVNPHDICYMAIRDAAPPDRPTRMLSSPKGVAATATLDRALRIPAGVTEEEFFATHCPPLPENHEPQKGEPEAIRRALERSAYRAAARETYTERRWRMHRWAYCRLTEMADAQIARVLEAVRASGQEHDTLIIFTSDHGDLDSAHKLEQKGTLYEEDSRVPLLISQPGVTPAGVCSHLVSNGLDLLPTICDFAGVETPAGLAGISLRRLARGAGSTASRECIPVESRTGRMIVTRDYKYKLFDEGQDREQLIDLENDPGETRNAVDDVGYRGILMRCRELYAGAFA